MEQSNLLGQFVSYEENKVLWMRIQILIQTGLARLTSPPGIDLRDLCY